MKSDDGPPNLAFDFAENGGEPVDQPPTGDLTQLAATSPPTKLLLDVREVGEALGCGKTYVYELIARGELRTVKLGRLTRIPADSLVELRLPEDRIGAAGGRRLLTCSMRDCRRRPTDSRLTPYLTPYRANSPGHRRSSRPASNPFSNTKRPSTVTHGLTTAQLKNRWRVTSVRVRPPGSASRTCRDASP